MYVVYSAERTIAYRPMHVVANNDLFPPALFAIVMVIDAASAGLNWILCWGSKRDHSGIPSANPCRHVSVMEHYWFHVCSVWLIYDLVFFNVFFMRNCLNLFQNHKCYNLSVLPRMYRYCSFFSFSVSFFPPCEMNTGVINIWSDVKWAKRPLGLFPQGPSALTCSLNYSWSWCSPLCLPAVFVLQSAGRAGVMWIDWREIILWRLTGHTNEAPHGRAGPGG